VEKTISSLKLEDKNTFKNAHSHIDSEWAVVINESYNEIGNHFDINNNSEVDQFLFAISLDIWPIRKKHC
jgi:hypothetical protein